MVKNNFKKGLVIFLITIVLMIIFGNLSLTYAGSYTITASKQSVEKGKTFTVTVNVSGLTGKFNISGTNCSVNKSSEFIDTSGTITITATAANSVGTATVKVTADNVADSSTAAEITGSKSVSVSITEPVPVAKSKDANLKNLGIRPNDFSGFKAATTTYNVTVPNSVSTIEVYASASHSKASVSGTGKNKSLKEGKNTFEVTVTAEDGKTKKTYTLNVTRLAPGEEPDEPVEETPVETTEVTLGLKSLTIKGIDFLPLFDKTVTSYVCTVGSEIDKLEITAIPDPDDAIIEINGNDKLKIGENIITILIKVGESTATYQITVNKEESVVEEAIIEENIDIDKDTKTKIWIVVGSILGIIVVTSGLNIILYIENMRLSDGISDKRDIDETPEFKYQSYTDETDFGNDKNKRGKHS